MATDSNGNPCHTEMAVCMGKELVERSALKYSFFFFIVKVKSHQLGLSRELSLKFLAIGSTWRPSSSPLTLIIPYKKIQKSLVTLRCFHLVLGRYDVYHTHFDFKEDCSPVATLCRAVGQFAAAHHPNGIFGLFPLGQFTHRACDQQ